MKNKSVISTFFLIMIISYVYPNVVIKQTVFAQQTTRSSTNFVTYENSTYGIKLQYPSNWDKEENGTRQDTQTDVVTFSPPSINSNASLDISIDDISDSKGTTLTQYASDQIDSLKQQYANNQFKLLESKNNLVLAGLPAYAITYTSADQNTILKDREIGAIKGDKVYILTYEAGTNEYNKYFPTIQQMINSFQITK